MRGLKIFKIVRPNRLRLFDACVAEHQSRMLKHLFFFTICVFTAPILLSGCSHVPDGFQEANNLFSQGNYNASLNKYEQMLKKQTTKGDRILFEMGIIYAYPKNDQKDYQKSLEYFQKLIKEYPKSEYRQNSEAMIFSINNAPIKDKLIAAQQTQIKHLQQEVKCRDNQIIELQKDIKALEQKFFAYAIRKGSADKILVEKNARRLKLLSKGEVLKTYKISLGGNPIGPKEREGDNKTPEGTYLIDGRNQDSLYHRSFHISYPNEKDKLRARKMGVSPGGNIMIHGIKKGFSWVGDAHTEVDWTKGCIAVTDDEIEEIGRLAPIGTIVEIRP
ncbi:MAG: L,D-transpeptidase family protein [Geobacteraceae bacterium]